MLVLVQQFQNLGKTFVLFSLNPEYAQELEIKKQALKVLS